MDNLGWLKTAWWIGAAMMLLMLASAANGLWSVPLYAVSSHLAESATAMALTASTGTGTGSPQWLTP